MADLSYILSPNEPPPHSLQAGELQKAKRGTAALFACQKEACGDRMTATEDQNPLWQIADLARA
jgi:hypothetical protein